MPEHVENKNLAYIHEMLDSCTNNPRLELQIRTDLEKIRALDDIARELHVLNENIGSMDLCKLIAKAQRSSGIMG